MAGRAHFRKGGKIERIEKKLTNPEAALKQIGALMVAESQRAFKEQQFGTKKWDGRSPVNVFGIIADFHEGKRKPPARRFEARPALRDTGRLASSIAFKVSGMMVEVGTNLDYANVHQTGGDVESKPITATVQKLLWSWLKKQSSQLKARLGFLLNKKYTGEKLKGKVPARPFIGITDTTRKNVSRMVGVHIMEVK
jgi:phage gpG-like protein